MAAVDFSRLDKAFGNSIALDAFELSVKSGEFCVLLGPSGCGKSTLLRVLAGLEKADSGSIRVDGREISHWPPGRREIAMVFQDYTLYPHMKVRQIITYALRVSGLPRSEIDSRLAQSVKLLGIADCLDSKPHELSGGQRQRVAIAKCLVRQPKLFLFDEPLSSLDADLRVQIRQEMIQLHRQLENCTTFFVTHDQQEAMTMADRLVVMANGRVQQVGTPEEVYTLPANRFVAGFVGSPRMNFLPARWQRTSSSVGQLQIEGADYRWLIRQRHAALNMPQDLVVGIRPEHWRTVTSRGHHLRIDQIEFMGQTRYYHGTLHSGQTLTMQAQEMLTAVPGSTVKIGFMPYGIHLFNPESGNRIAPPWLSA